MISSMSVEPSSFKSEQSLQLLEMIQSTINITSITFDSMSSFKSLGTIEHSMHSEVSWYPIASSERHPGYGKQKLLYDKSK